LKSPFHPFFHSRSRSIIKVLTVLVIIGALGMVSLSATATTVAVTFSPTVLTDQAADIEQNNVYTWISSLFTTGYTASAVIPSGQGTVYYTANLTAPSTSVSEIQIESSSGQVLSTAKGNGWSVSDSFDFSFSGYSEYIMYLYYSESNVGSLVATTTNGVLAESSDGFVYALSTNTPASGTVFTTTQNITSSTLQAVITITEKTTTPPPSDATIHFIESGLPTGTSWSVTYHSVLNGYTGANTTQSSTTDEIDVTMAIGNTIYYWISSYNGLTPSPSEGIINLVSNTTVNVVYPTPVAKSYSVTFVPIGIPSGTTWGVTLAGLQLFGSNLNGQNPDISFSETNGSYAYSVYVPSPDTASPASGTITVNGGPVTQDITINVPVKDYTMSFTETGLPSGVDFTVATGVGSASGSPTASFSVPNGTYSFTIANIVSGGNTYIPTPASGTVTVNGANVNEPITFTEQAYTVTFTETGLPSGTTWYLNITNGQTFSSSSTSITFDEFDGSYSYTLATNDPAYAPSTPSGSFTVNNAAVSITVSFVQNKYSVTFSETGLPSGSVWYINLTNGQTFSSSSTSLVFSEPDGSYSYSVSTNNPAYAPSMSSGSFTMDNSPVSLSVTFVENTYSVTFQESGLPSGTLWGVTFGTSSQTSTTTSITFNGLLPGTYPYTAMADGYNNIYGNETIVASSPKEIFISLTLESNVINTAAPTVNITSSQNYYINGTVTPPSSYGRPDWTNLFVDVSEGSYNKSLSFSPPDWNFSLQVPTLNVTYHMSFQLVGKVTTTGQSLESAKYVTTVKMPPASSSSQIPTYYSISPPSGTTIYSSQTINLYLKGNVTYSGLLSFSSPLDYKNNITMNSTELSNGTQSLHYALNITSMPSGTYTFKFLVIYQGKTLIALSSQYYIESVNAITLKYSYNYTETSSGLYNTYWNITEVDNSSNPSPVVNALNLSVNGKEIGFLKGKPFTSNGHTRDYFVFTISNLSKGTYNLTAQSYNVNGNVMTSLFTENYTFTVPTLPPSPPGGGGVYWQNFLSWFHQGYNEYIVVGVSLVIIVGAAIAYSSSGSSKYLYAQSGQNSQSGNSRSGSGGVNVNVREYIGSQSKNRTNRPKSKSHNRGR